MFTKKLTSLAALGAASVLALSSCAPAGDDAGGGGDSADKNVTIAVFNGWDEGIAVSELWRSILEDKGYNVELEYADPAPVFIGLQSQDYDVTMDVWVPETHASYLEQYGNDIVDLGAWNTESRLTLAVNEDAPIDSLAELADNADLFGGRIVGIEPGAGLTEVTQDRVIPTYGLEDFDFVTSSTPAMLSELTAAIDNDENIVVTLWEPHWANGAFPIKNLEDPEGALGSTESIHSYSRTGFADDHPEVAQWLSSFTMSLDQLYSLEQLLFVDNDTNDYGPLVEQWIEENREWVDGLTAS